MHRFCLTPVPTRSPPPTTYSVRKPRFANHISYHFMKFIFHIATIDVATLVARARLSSGQALDIVDAQ